MGLTWGTAWAPIAARAMTDRVKRMLMVVGVEQVEIVGGWFEKNGIDGWLDGDGCGCG
jgi:hypothetical protein